MPRLWGQRPKADQPRAYLHIGAMKTGTTYLQGKLHANKAELGAESILVRTGAEAAYHDFRNGYQDDRTTSSLSGAWNRMTTRMNQHPGVSVASMEFFSFLGPEDAERVVGAFTDAELHIVLTVRDAVSAIPAQWQTRARSGGQLGYGKFLRGIESYLHDHQSTAPGASLFRRTQDIPRMLQVWVPLVGADRVHVVTVPPSGSDPTLLWQRFASVMQIDPGIAVNEPEFSNASLGHDSSELVRRVNQELGRINVVDQRYVVKIGLARHILGPRAGEEPKVRLNRHHARVAAGWNRTVRDSVTEHRTPVIGALEDLPVRIEAEKFDEHLHRVSPEAMIAAATTGWSGMWQLINRMQGLGGLTVTAPDPVPDWSSTSRPGDNAVKDLADLTRSALGLHHEVTKDGLFTVGQLFN